MAWIVGAVLAVLALGILASAWLTVRRVSDRIERLPGAFAIPDAERPERVAGTARAVNLLLAGLDGDDVAGRSRGARSDAIMVLHLDADRRAAWLVSIPRDAWVPIPGRGENKVNAAYSLGGPALFVRTVESLTGLRMDHLVVVDWTGVRRLTEAVGGVPLSLSGEAAPDSTRADVAVALSGPQALEYLSERKALPGGDLDRIKRQQHFLSALLGQAMARRLFTDPSALRSLASAIGEAVRVDAGLTTGELLALATSVRRLRVEDVTFLTAPISGLAMRGEASVVEVDRERGGALWQAMAHDRMATFVAAHPRLVTPRHVR